MTDLLPDHVNHEIFVGEVDENFHFEIRVWCRCGRSPRIFKHEVPEEARKGGDRFIDYLERVMIEASNTDCPDKDDEGGMEKRAVVVTDQEKKAQDKAKKEIERSKKREDEDEART